MNAAPHSKPTPQGNLTIVGEPEETTLEFQALETVIRALTPHTEEARRRIIHSASTFLRLHSVQGESTTQKTVSTAPQTPHRDFSQDRSSSPKQFLLEKKPHTMVERIACLAFYLTHYRDLPHFKNVDLTAINTEAAQPRITNPARDIGNAQSTGYLVPAGKGERQISAAGEAFVLALPDREAARAAMSSSRPRRKPKKGKSLSGASNNSVEPEV